MGSFMDEDDAGFVEKEKGKTLVQTLLNKEQQVLQESLFRDVIFKVTYRKVRIRELHT